MALKENHTNFKGFFCGFWRYVSAPFGHGFVTPTFKTHTRLVITNSFCMLDITQASNSAIKAENSKFYVVLVSNVVWWPWRGFGVS